MTCDNTKVRHMFTHQFSTTLCYIFMGCTMETITTDTIVFIIRIRKRIHISFFRHCLVECSIKYSNLWYVRHNSLTSFNTLNIWWVMQWSKRCTFFQSIHNCRCNQYGISKFFTTMYYTVTNCINFIHGFNNTKLSIN